MAFTAGTPELAKAQKLGNALSEMFIRYGSAFVSGVTGIQLIERKAREMGFGVTGVTTGGAFPPFGSAGLAGNRVSVFGSVTGVLQNPAGLTQPNGVTIADFGTGRTVGIYMPKFIRDGADTTVPNNAAAAVAGKTFGGFAERNSVNWGFTATVYFSGSASGATAGVTFSVN